MRCTRSMYPRSSVSARCVSSFSLRRTASVLDASSACSIRWCSAAIWAARARFPSMRSNEALFGALFAREVQQRCAKGSSAAAANQTTRRSILVRTTTSSMSGSDAPWLRRRVQAERSSRSLNLCRGSNLLTQNHGLIRVDLAHWHLVRWWLMRKARVFGRLPNPQRGFK